MKSVLFVCLGNICRSPTGESVLNRMIEEQNLSDQVRCESAGTANYHVGERPDHRTRAHGEKRGYRFDSLAQQFDPTKDFERFDLIVCMDQNNLMNVQKLDPSAKYRHKTKLLMDFAPASKHREVPDPYYGDIAHFEQVIDLCEEACKGLLKTLL